MYIIITSFTYFWSWIQIYFAIYRGIFGWFLTKVKILEAALNHFVAALTDKKKTVCTANSVPTNEPGLLQASLFSAHTYSLQVNEFSGEYARPTVPEKGEKLLLLTYFDNFFFVCT